jgi:hypothetical protein
MEHIGLILAVISLVCVAFEGGLTPLIFGVASGWVFYLAH